MKTGHAPEAAGTAPAGAPPAAASSPAALAAGAAALATLAASPAPGVPDAVVTTDRNGRLRANTADLPGRCTHERSTINYAQPAFKGWQEAFHAPNVADAVIDLLVADKNMAQGHVYPGVVILAGVTDYFEHRQHIQDLFEQKMARKTGEEYESMYHAYALFLIYNGEFKKIISFFEPDTRPGRPHAEDGPTHFILSQAYFRLGMYETALLHAKIAFAKNDERDTRWQLMVSELGLYGDDFYKKASRDLYTVDHIEEIFPNHDRSKLPFDEVSDRLGMDRWGGTGSVSLADFDNDGWDDLLQERKYFPMRIYRNEQGKHFKQIPDKQTGWSSCSAILAPPADFDNDFKVDFVRVCCNYDGWGEQHLMKNEGGLSFKDITEGSGFGVKNSSTHNIAWADFDLDGNLDLAINDAFGPTRLWHNLGNDRFEEVTAKSGINTLARDVVAGVPNGGNAVAYGGIGIGWGDYDNDGWPDLFIDGWDMKKLYRNKHDGTFEDVSVKAGITGGGKRGYTAFFFDFDNDGLLDIFNGQYVVNSGEKWGYSPICTCSNLITKDGYSEREWHNSSSIFRNKGDGTFEDTADTKQTKFIPLGSMGTDHGDWNNDGYEDLVFSTGGPYMQQEEPIAFYQSNGDGTFSNLTVFTDTRFWGKGHGEAFADINHDGALDLVLNLGGATGGDIYPSLILLNRGNANHWINIGLKGGRGTNSYAVGGRVTVKAGGKSYMKELQAGSNFSATNSLSLHFGLAQASEIEEVTIRWPNLAQTVTTLTHVPVDEAIEVTQDDGKYRKVW
jgi:hypothetical protein